jgi:hypothetical protein
MEVEEEAEFSGNSGKVVGQVIVIMQITICRGTNAYSSTCK